MKNVITTLCTDCNETQDVKHILLYCKNERLINNRKLFERKISNHIGNYNTLTEGQKLKTILSLHPIHGEKLSDQAIEYICTYIKKVYGIIQDLPTPTVT